MRKFKFILVVAVMITAVFLAACGGGSDEPAASDAASGQASISVLMHDIYFGDSNDNAANPPTWTVKSGQLVTVNADNQGALDHNWAFVEAGAELPDTITDPAEIEDLIVFDVGVVAGGDTYNKPFNSPIPGEYLVICTVAGHYPSMQGTLVVEE